MVYSFRYCSSCRKYVGLLGYIYHFLKGHRVMYYRASTYYHDIWGNYRSNFNHVQKYRQLERKIGEGKN